MNPLSPALLPPRSDIGDIALSEFFDGHPVATFAIDRQHVVTHWNRACEHLLGWTKADMIGTDHHWQAFYPRARPVLADLILDDQLDQLAQHYGDKFSPCALIPGAYEAEDFFPNIGASGHWLHFTAAPLRDKQGRLVGAIETLRDVTERRVAENALRRAYDNLEHLVRKRTAQLADMNEQLQDDIRQRHQAEADQHQRPPAPNDIPETVRIQMPGNQQQRNDAHSNQDDRTRDRRHARLPVLRPHHGTLGTPGIALRAPCGFVLLLLVAPVIFRIRAKGCAIRRHIWRRAGRSPRRRWWHAGHRSRSPSHLAEKSCSKRFVTRARRWPGRGMPERRERASACLAISGTRLLRRSARDAFSG